MNESYITVTADRSPIVVHRERNYGSPAGQPLLPSPPRSQKKPKEPSIIEWFDKTVEAELSLRRPPELSPKLNLQEGAGTRHPLVVESSVSGIDIEAGLRGERDTELAEAVDRFAKAEAMVAFEGAVKAAEAAAANAPPELAEEAAVAGAKDYQAELTSVVKQEVPGVRPVEVIGYVGITRPKIAKKRN